MKPFYDLIIGLCCYKSVDQTLRLIRSANNIEGSILFTVTTILDEDTQALKDGLGVTKSDVKIFQSKVDARYFSQNWGFVWCFNNHIHSTFWGTMDDDTMFVGSGDLIEQLYKASEVGFSVMGFMSSSHPYAGYKGFGDIGKYKNLLFVDGHNMFSHYNDNAMWGLCDSVGNGNISYVEVEYTNRLKYFTGKPILAQPERVFINHVFRADPALNDLRAPFQSRDMTNGGNLYREKYGITILPNSPGFSWEKVVDDMNAAHETTRRRHLVYGGITNNWKQIYDTFGKEFTCV